MCLFKMKEDFEKIKQFLDLNHIRYHTIEHPPMGKSEEVAEMRGVDIKTGAKSMIVRSEGKFYNFVLSAAKKIDWNKVKRILSTKSVDMASPEEIMKTVNCEIGSIPPFGNLYNLKVYCDKSLSENEEINFNAGTLTDSIKMKYKDWVKVVNPEICEFSK